MIISNIKQEWIPAPDLQGIRITSWTPEKQQRKAMLAEDVNFLQAFQVAQKSNTSLPSISKFEKQMKIEVISRKEEPSLVAFPKKEEPSGLVAWAKNHPWQAGAASALTVAVIGTGVAYGIHQLAGPQLAASSLVAPQLTAPGLLEARPLELPKEWLEKAPLPTCSLTPPFNVGITPARSIAKIDLPICPSAACPVPNPYEWPQTAPVEKVPYSALNTLKWLGTGAAIVTLATATAPLVLPVAAGSAALAAIGAAATTIGIAARSVEAYEDIAAGDYGSAAFKAATVAAGPLLGGIGSLAGRAGTETMTVAARTLNDPARMQQLSNAGWKLVDLGAKGADYLRNGGTVTNFLMQGARFVLKR